MRCAKQLQTVRSPITFFRVVFAISGSYLFHFFSYRFEARQYCFYAYKECSCRFSTGKSGHIIGFTGGTAYTQKLVYILCLSALAKCGYSHGPYYVTLPFPKIESITSESRPDVRSPIPSCAHRGLQRYVQTVSKYSLLLSPSSD